MIEAEGWVRRKGDIDQCLAGYTQAVQWRCCDENCAKLFFLILVIASDMFLITNAKGPFLVILQISLFSIAYVLVCGTIQLGVYLICVCLVCFRIMIIYWIIGMFIRCVSSGVVCVWGVLMLLVVCVGCFNDGCSGYITGSVLFSSVTRRS